ncbi:MULTISPECIES: MarR family winged helix-turn-helix transcriptional regulator [Saccharopolyspora]|uniref:MarR family winged helix-turn-helix transcriptional regulator n=1 Tax=Saccharopolyspora TaxID=1835 RepID=UPI001CD45E80|nr:MULTISPECIES: MarR family winged helix-turn-helix transcriptional regulator [Saccharopolyspora]MCA1187198.1 MarR family winged helix-turn-helix transcriptional regulator [Saccharopolyspora sp. 6T]MCA1194320.1 MarR family winged helix-turn-helix transcriptional regulator [Saccharopolyspora sp. 6V]MCA1227238.1 MarR family winged helix-turn-helix transcriptional regulator [Saccharopolyspora sp. 6M]MCA1282713.1 MarR family winged helix-turn-helix transcriptional regulator [Saccharopolyspora sp. 
MTDAQHPRAAAGTELPEPGPPSEPDGTTCDAIDTVEFQTAVLMRNLEMLCRRGELHQEVDRAGYLLLRTLIARGPSDIGGLAAALGLDPSTTGRQVLAAERAGHLTRSPDGADRRRSVLAITGSGAAAVRAVCERRRERTAALLSGWSEQDLRLLSEMVSRYNRAIAEEFLETDPPGGAS